MTGVDKYDDALGFINPMLSEQLFEYIPYMSCWFWGHEHALTFFADDVYGLPKGRLLGNSGVHVYDQDKGNPY